MRYDVRSQKVNRYRFGSTENLLIIFNARYKLCTDNALIPLFFTSCCRHLFNQLLSLFSNIRYISVL